MEVMRKQSKMKEYKRCELCDDGSKLAGNHKNSSKHLALSNRKNAIEMGFIKIEVPEFEYYTSNEFVTFRKKYQYRNFTKSKDMVPLPFGPILILETEFGYNNSDYNYSAYTQTDYWVKKEDLCEIYFSMVNTAIELEHREETERFPKFKKESVDYDAFTDKYCWYNKDTNPPDLEYKDTHLDLQYAIIQFPHIRKTLLVVKESGSNQYNTRTFKYYQDMDDEYSSIDSLIFGWDLSKMIHDGLDIVRQGDLYLTSVVTEIDIEFPSEDAQHTWEENGYESHKPEMLGVYQGQVVIKGKLEHPEHKDLTLKKWHRIIDDNLYD